MELLRRDPVARNSVIGENAAFVGEPGESRYFDIAPS
jgi:hypothetical protein